MDIRYLLQDCFLAIFLLNLELGHCLQDDDYEDGPALGRCPWIRNKLKNGRVRYRYKGRVAKFLCDSGFELAGKRSSTCVRGQWSNPVPVCVARGCSRVPSVANGRVTEMYRGALLVYDCNPGYTLNGDSSIHCDGRRWNASPPVCGVSTPDPETHCDFESIDLCGWTHDPTHDFDWRRNQFSTPSGHVGTGPSHDHTFGENKAGYYLFIEASSPRKTNDTARLFSPVYPSDESGGCFSFWYHMYGSTTGGLRIFLKPESHVFGELLPKWQKFGDQGNQWLRGNISIPQLNENFQIVIEGIRGESYVGDSAIDDVQLTKHDCESMQNVTEITTENTIAESCRGRCRGTDSSYPCQCNENCYLALNCCNDYVTLCSEGNETHVQNTDEPLPGDYYANITSPSTVTITLSSPRTAEEQTSSAFTNESFHDTSQPSSNTSITAAISLSTSTSVPITSSTVVIPSSTALPSTKIPEIILTTEVTTSTSIAFNFTASPSTEIKPETVSTASSVPITKAESSTSPSTLSTGTPETTKKLEVLTTDSLQTSSTVNTTIMTSTTSSTTIVKATTTQYVTKEPVSTTTASTTTSTTTSNIPISTSTSTKPSSTSTTVLYYVNNTLSEHQLISSSKSSESSSETTSASPTSTIPSTSTPRYNLRPRKTTTTSVSTESFTTFSTYRSNTTTGSTERSSPNTVVTPQRTETSTLFPVTGTATQRRIWFNFTRFATVTVGRTSRTSTNVPTGRSTTTQNTPETSKFTFRFLTSSPFIAPTSVSTTTESKDIFSSKAESTKSHDNPAVVISVVVIIIICAAGGGIAYYLRKNKMKRRTKLYEDSELMIPKDDSEMRYLPESEFMEYSDSTALDRILLK